VEKTGFTPAMCNKALEYLERFGIVKELTARRRKRLFSYAGYIRTWVAASSFRAAKSIRHDQGRYALVMGVAL
jgi:hypothetical protein